LSVGLKKRANPVKTAGPPQISSPTETPVVVAAWCGRTSRHAATG
jgi:hypothetical protein